MAKQKTITNEQETQEINPEQLKTDWNKFRQHIEQNGNKYVRARHPLPPETLINTLWSGIPVDNYSVPQVRTLQGEWIDYK